MITDLRSFLKVSCHTKFRFAECEAQCILGECGPLRLQLTVKTSGLSQAYDATILKLSYSVKGASNILCPHDGGFPEILGPNLLTSKKNEQHHDS